MKFLGEHARERATYRDDGHWPPMVAEVPVTDTELAAWRIRWQATCSAKVGRLLCALERDYGRRPA